MASPYLTVNEAAEELGMSAGNLRKLVHSGKLKAIKRSERKTLIPRLSLDAYLARLNGGGPQIGNDRGPRISLRERVAGFVNDTAETPEAWLGAWKNGLRPDTAENMQLAIRALSIALESEAVPDSTLLKHGGGELVTHERDGTIRQTDTVG